MKSPPPKIISPTLLMANELVLMCVAIALTLKEPPENCISFVFETFSEFALFRFQETPETFELMLPVTFRVFALMTLFELEKITSDETVCTELLDRLNRFVGVV